MMSVEMAKLSSLLPARLYTLRLELELFAHTPEHYECLLSCINSGTTHERMGDWQVRKAEDFDRLNYATRIDAATLGIQDSAVVDCDVYYLPRLKKDEADRAGVALLPNGKAPVMGAVSLAQRGKEMPPDIGWNLLEQYHGHGYAPEAAKALLDMACTTLGLTWLSTMFSPGNSQSRRVAEKLGMAEGGELDDDRGQTHYVMLLRGVDFDALRGKTIKVWGDLKDENPFSGEYEQK